MKLTQVLYAVSDWKMPGKEGLTIFLDKKSALKYYNIDDGNYLHRHCLYISNELDESGQVKWINISELAVSENVKS